MTSQPSKPRPLGPPATGRTYWLGLRITEDDRAFLAAMGNGQPSTGAYQLIRQALAFHKLRDTLTQREKEAGE